MTYQPVTDSPGRASAVLGKFPPMTWVLVPFNSDLELWDLLWSTKEKGWLIYIHAAGVAALMDTNLSRPIPVSTL